MLLLAAAERSAPAVLFFSLLVLRKLCATVHWGINDFVGAKENHYFVQKKLINAKINKCSSSREDVLQSRPSVFFVR